jgi:hypothetical protein
MGRDRDTMIMSPGVLSEGDRPSVSVAPFSGSFYDPKEEYRLLLDSAGIDESPADLEKEDPANPSSYLTRPEPYQVMMSREKRVLDTLNRVVDDNVQSRNASHDPNAVPSLLTMPVHEVAMRTAGSVRALLDDLLDSRSQADVLNALTDPDRAQFLGIALVFAGLFLAVVNYL